MTLRARRTVFSVVKTAGHEVLLKILLLYALARIPNTVAAAPRGTMLLGTRGAVVCEVLTTRHERIGKGLLVLAFARMPGTVTMTPLWTIPVCTLLAAV
eukprot:CAMPEP_0115058760 /NCGR_PEP_ID=MMETSP0227-20121206/6533_1 /TAXON_ID=89957 /ORGANISM="Polarella glacialis, Strain CCMP 1383" /LENGTH=98 /DNA_ID=CAMNT_0002443791 /DNA_START=133 /DNA_END=429 /DNA_ORIENTATION=-